MHGNFSFSNQHQADIIFSGGGSSNPYDKFVTAGVTSQYIDITIPIYDRTDPNVAIVTTHSEFQQAVNNVAINIILTQPGVDYTPSTTNVAWPGGEYEPPRDSGSANTPIYITRSGTAQDRLFILLEGNDNIHPCQLADNQLARYRLEFTNADYWYVDRMAYFEEVNAFNRIDMYASSNNIFNAPYYRDTQNGWSLNNGCDNNSIQFLFAEKTQWSVDNKVFGDQALINFVMGEPNELIKDNRVVHSEIVNYVDSIQTVRWGNASTANANIGADGLLIWDNNLYVTNLLYSDGSGNSDINGSQSFSENAIDLKTGSQDELNPIVIRHNNIFGMRPVDNTYSALSDAGAGIVSHYDVGYVDISLNQFGDTQLGFLSGSPQSVGEYPIRNSNISNNSFYGYIDQAIAFEGDINSTATDATFDVLVENNYFTSPVVSFESLKAYASHSLTINDNLFEDTYALYFAAAFGVNYESAQLTITNNIFKDSGTEMPTYATTSSNTYPTGANTADQYVKSFYIRKFDTAPILKDFLA